MTQKIIGVDIDGVLTDESHSNQNIWHDYLCRYLGKEVVRSADSFEFHKAYQLSEEVIKGFMAEHVEEIYRVVKPCTGARDTLSKLSEQGFTIILITARNNQHRTLTEDWLNRHQFPYNRLIHDRDKAPLAVAANIQLFIEDNGRNALELAANKIPVVLVNKYHNSFVEPHRLITRVEDWTGIRREVFAYFQLNRSENAS